MKPTGIVLKVDELGRVALPGELMGALGVAGKDDELEVFIDGSTVSLKKHEPYCMYCSPEKAAGSGEKKICSVCAIDSWL